MRNIKFRGQQINTKKWIYGYLYRNKGLYVICENIRYAEEEPILIETVGQYTGLKDLDNKELYEGDIIQHCFEYCDETDRYIIEWDEDNLQYVFRNMKNKNNYISLEDLYSDDIGDYAIRKIGNIYDNPDLLDKGAEE